MNIKNLLKSVDYKGLALQHCEKAVIVVVTALLVLFFFNGARRAMSASDIKPETIAELADRLTKKIQDSTWEGSSDQSTIQNPPFDDQIKALTTPEEADKHKLVQWFFHFVDFGGVLRDKPEILRPYDSYVLADRGAMATYKLGEDGKPIEEEVIVKVTSKKKDNPDDEVKKKPAKGAPTKSGSPGKGKASGAPGMMGGPSGGSGGDSMGFRRGGSGMTGPSGGGMGGIGGMLPGGGGAGAAGGAGAGGGTGMGGGGIMGGSDSDGGDLSGNIGAARHPGTGGSIRRSKSKDEEDDSQFAGASAGPKGGDDGKPGDPKAPQKRKVKKEETHGVRWTMITALFPHGDQVKEYIKKLHTAEDPPVYNMVMVERREVLSDGSLSEWASIDMKKEAKLVDLIPPRYEQENAILKGANAIFKGLVMPLPRLEAGKWHGYNASEAFQAAKDVSTGGSQFTGRGGGSEDGDQESNEDANGRLFGAQGAGGFSGAGGNSGPMPSSGPAGAGGGGGRPQAGGFDARQQGGPMGAGGGMMGTPGGATGGQTGSQQGKGGGVGGGIQAGQAGGKEKKGTQRSNAQLVQIRFIDYTVEPEHTYQYRLKVVVENPNFKRLDVVSNDVADEKTLTSKDWSEPTDFVFVPADTEYYVLERTKATNREEAKMHVHKWLADLGDWQFAEFLIRPGEPIGGEVREYPLVDWEEHVKKTRLDFSTQDLLLNVSGGNKVYTFVIDGKENQFNEPLPAEIFVVDRMGELATRSQDFDLNYAERKTREAYITDLKKTATEQDKETSKKPGKPESGTKDDFDKPPTRKSGGDAGRPGS